MVAGDARPSPDLTPFGHARALLTLGISSSAGHRRWLDQT